MPRGSFGDSAVKVAAVISGDAQPAPHQRQRRRTALNTRGSSPPSMLSSRWSTRSRSRNTIPTCPRRSNGSSSRRTACRWSSSTKRRRCSWHRRCGCAIACRFRNDRSCGFRSSFRPACSRYTWGRFRCFRSSSRRCRCPRSTHRRCLRSSSHRWRRRPLRLRRLRRLPLEPRHGRPRRLRFRRPRPRRRPTKRHYRGARRRARGPARLPARCFAPPALRLRCPK
jgi:hypothetical protein